LVALSADLTGQIEDVIKWRTEVVELTRHGLVLQKRLDDSGAGLIDLVPPSVEIAFTDGQLGRVADVVSLTIDQTGEGDFAPLYGYAEESVRAFGHDLSEALSACP
jgi:hypothetical protein